MILERIRTLDDSRLKNGETPAQYHNRIVSAKNVSFVLKTAMFLDKQCALKVIAFNAKILVPSSLSNKSAYSMNFDLATEHILIMCKNIEYINNLNPDDLDYLLNKFFTYKEIAAKYAGKDFLLISGKQLPLSIKTGLKK